MVKRTRLIGKTAKQSRKSFPPSLSKIQGVSEWQFQKEECQRRLEEIMHGLPLQPGVRPSIPNFARDLFEYYIFARTVATTKRKTRAVGPAGLKLQLRKIETGARRLATLLKSAHANVFQAWVRSREPNTDLEHQNVTREWLQLRRLLESAADRARIAAQARKPLSEVSENRGRPPSDIADAITTEAANAYQELTGLIAARRVDWESGQPVGPFHDFLTEIFAALDIQSSPDAANMRLQSTLTQIGSGRKRSQ
jgi:hypothetical protein